MRKRIVFIAAALLISPLLAQAEDGRKDSRPAPSQEQRQAMKEKLKNADTNGDAPGSAASKGRETGATGPPRPQCNQRRGALELTRRRQHHESPCTFASPLPQAESRSTEYF